MGRLDNKVLIVTGSTQGIGATTALLAADSGAAGIVICGRQQDKGKSVEAEIRDKGCSAVYVPADLSDVDQCRRVVQTCDEQFGRIDCLVNAAADTSRISRCYSAAAWQQLRAIREHWDPQHVMHDFPGLS